MPSGQPWWTPPIRFGSARRSTRRGSSTWWRCSRCPGGPRGATALTLTAACWPQLRIARIVSDHSPLALDIALRAARETMRSPDAAVAFVHSALSQMWSGAWTSSAWTADQPVPIRQRLRSLLPGTSYVVTRAPRVAVARVGRNGSLVVPPLPDGASRTLVTQAPGLAKHVAHGLAEALGAESVVQVSFAGAWTGVLGNPRAVQLALVPSTLRRQLPPPPGFQCGCGLRSIEATCPFCRVFAHPLASSEAVS